MRALGEGKAISYGFSLITNGTLLTEKTAGVLRPLGLREASITMKPYLDAALPILVSQDIGYNLVSV